MRNLSVKISFILCTLLLSANSVWAYWTTDRNGNPQADNVSIKGYVSKSGSTYYVLDDPTVRSIYLSLLGMGGEYKYNINGPAAILTFDTKSDDYALSGLRVAQRVIGDTKWSDTEYNKNPGSKYENSGPIPLDEKAVELSFYNKQALVGRYFKNVKVTMASYCTPEKTSIEFGSTTCMSSDDKTLKIYWSNKEEQLISISGDADRFTLSTKSIPSKAGYYGNTVVTITYKRDVVGSHKMTLTINGQTVTVTGTTTQATPLLTADKSSLTFGTNEHPLQEPQAITLSYSSLGECGSTANAITVTSTNAAFYVDEQVITAGVGVEQKGTYTVRVRCNDVNRSGNILFESNDGTKLEVPVSSAQPAITATATKIFQTGTEHAPVSGTSYRALRTHDFSACFNNDATPKFDTLYIYGVSESAAASREWEDDPDKGYKVPAVTASNVHTPCFVYQKEGAQYTYARTFDASTKTLNVEDTKTRVFVGYRAEAPTSPAIQVNGTNAELYLNNIEIVANSAPLTVNATSAVYANGINILSSTDNAAVQLSGATNFSIQDTWTGDVTSATLALRPKTGYPSIDLGSDAGKVTVNGTQLELHNATKMAIAHMDGTTETFVGEVQINDGSIGGETTLGMPKRTFIDGGTFNDGTVEAYTLQGVAKRPRNSRGDMLSRQTMTKETLKSGYAWYGQDHLTPDVAVKVNPMLMDETVWIFNGANSENSDDKTSWTKNALPGENDDVLINAPMVIAEGELKVKSLTINWENKGKGIPAVTVKPAGGLTVGEGGVDALKVVNLVENLALKAGTDADDDLKGQTGYLRIHPNAAEPMPKATVELFSIGYYNKAERETQKAAWQVVGAPIADAGVAAKSVYTKSWIYSWDEATNNWVNNRATLTFSPFVGYETTQYKDAAGMKLSYTGTLVSGAGERTEDLTFSTDGYNALANSYAAPIDISRFSTSDFINAEPTISVLNTGTQEQSENPGEDVNAPGKFLSIPVANAAEMASTFGYPLIIPSMQGFFVQATGNDAKIKLDYNRLVWNANYSDLRENKPLRAPKNTKDEQEELGSLKVTITANGWTDHVYILESENYDDMYESGYDARKMMSGDMDIYTINGEEQLSVNATNSIIGTRVGVRTGEETAYTLLFTHLNSETEIALLDSETGETTDINEGTEYTFFAAPETEITERFYIVERSNAPEIATDVDNVSGETKVQKFIKNGQMYILKNGVLYNATGAVVR